MRLSPHMTFVYPARPVALPDPFAAPLRDDDAFSSTHAEVRRLVFDALLGGGAGGAGGGGGGGGGGRGSGGGGGGGGGGKMETSSKARRTTGLASSTRSGALEALKEACEDPETSSVPFAWTADLCTAAAQEGRIDVLEALRGPGDMHLRCPWDADTCLAAFDKLDVLRFLRDANRGHGACPWDERVTSAAIARGNAVLVSQLAELGAPFAVGALIEAVDKSEVFDQLCKTPGVAIDSRHACDLAKLGRFDLLEKADAAFRARLVTVTTRAAEEASSGDWAVFASDGDNDDFEDGMCVRVPAGAGESIDAGVRAAESASLIASSLVDLANLAASGGHIEFLLKLEAWENENQNLVLKLHPHSIFGSASKWLAVFRSLEAKEGARADNTGGGGGCGGSGGGSDGGGGGGGDAGKRERRTRKVSERGEADSLRPNAKKVKAHVMKWLTSERARDAGEAEVEEALRRLKCAGETLHPSYASRLSWEAGTARELICAAIKHDSTLIVDVSLRAFPDMFHSVQGTETSFPLLWALKAGALRVAAHIFRLFNHPGEHAASLPPMSPTMKLLCVVRALAATRRGGVAPFSGVARTITNAFLPAALDGAPSEEKKKCAAELLESLSARDIWALRADRGAHPLSRLWLELTRPDDIHLLDMAPALRKAVARGELDSLELAFDLCAEAEIPLSVERVLSLAGDACAGGSEECVTWLLDFVRSAAPPGENRRGRARAFKTAVDRALQNLPSKQSFSAFFALVSHPVFLSMLPQVLHFYDGASLLGKLLSQLGTHAFVSFVDLCRRFAPGALWKSTSVSGSAVSSRLPDALVALTALQHGFGVRSGAAFRSARYGSCSAEVDREIQSVLDVESAECMSLVIGSPPASLSGDHLLFSGMQTTAARFLAECERKGGCTHAQDLVLSVLVDRLAEWQLRGLDTAVREGRLQPIRSVWLDMRWPKLYCFPRLPTTRTLARGLRESTDAIIRAGGWSFGDSAVAGVTLAACGASERKKRILELAAQVTLPLWVDAPGRTVRGSNENRFKEAFADRRSLEDDAERAPALLRLADMQNVDENAEGDDSERARRDSVRALAQKARFVACIVDAVDVAEMGERSGAKDVGGGEGRAAKAARVASSLRAAAKAGCGLFFKALLAHGEPASSFLPFAREASLFLAAGIMVFAALPAEEAAAVLHSPEVEKWTQRHAVKDPRLFEAGASPEARHKAAGVAMGRLREMSGELGRIPEECEALVREALTWLPGGDGGEGGGAGASA